MKMQKYYYQIGFSCAGIIVVLNRQTQNHEQKVAVRNSDGQYRSVSRFLTSHLKILDTFFISLKQSVRL